MARDPKSIYRRTPNWCPELDSLIKEVAHVITTQRIFFPRSLDYGGQINTSGIIQGVFIEAAKQSQPMTQDQWKQYVEVYTRMRFEQGTVQGIYFDDESLSAFLDLGKVFEKKPLPVGVKLKWGSGYRIHMMIAIVLQWFIDHHRNSQ